MWRLELIFYIETNFLMSIATGRDPQAGTLLQNPPESVQIAIPSICCLEALSALEEDEKSRRRLEQQLNIQIRQAERNLISPTAQSLQLNLEQASDANQMLIGETEMRMVEALNQIATKVELIALRTDMLQSSLSQTIIKDRTDNLILHCILGHARDRPTEEKVFLSGNVNDFGVPGVREALRQAGVSEYFSRTQDFLGWLQSQT
ncbi:MAG: PIN domain-containing protein [Hormoscilla sp.]